MATGGGKQPLFARRPHNARCAPPPPPQHRHGGDHQHRGLVRVLGSVIAVVFVPVVSGHTGTRARGRRKAIGRCHTQTQGQALGASRISPDRNTWSQSAEHHGTGEATRRLSGAEHGGGKGNGHLHVARHLGWALIRVTRECTHLHTDRHTQTHTWHEEIKRTAGAEH